MELQLCYIYSCCVFCPYVLTLPFCSVCVSQLPASTISFGNCSQGRSVDQVVAAVLAAGEQHRRRVSTATLNLVLREAVAWKAPPSQRGSLRQGRIYYATQAAVSPPTFVLFVNDPKLFPDDYRRWVQLAVCRACASTYCWYHIVKTLSAAGRCVCAYKFVMLRQGHCV
jgi:hypothetical protein